MQGGGVDDYEDRLGGGNPCEVAGEEVGDDFFIGADGVQGVGAGEVFQNNVGANVSLCDWYGAGGYAWAGDGSLAVFRVWCGSAGLF